ncbi:hypothetical protein CXB42_23180 [Pseudomonas syringae pv. syringae]|uniref:Uncharacterized protein n=1 Tax=Pseudomonas syringae pv. syringae TaxID=321 RepID=A0AAE5S3E1_PSESY|nr:hypothetical protein CXB42_23180 [Pseudomonas syringae pv. syringae]
MSYEPTSPENPYRLTGKQHFHMKAILKRFDGPHGIKVTKKADGAVSYHEADDGIFLSRRAWSQEAESDNGAEPRRDKYPIHHQLYVQRKSPGCS